MNTDLYAAHELELESQLAELALDGTYDHYLREFFNITDADMRKLDGYYYAGDLCRPLADAWCKAEVNGHA